MTENEPDIIEQPTVQKRVNLTINGVAHVQGNRGEQWEIQIKYPFSQYATKQWVDKDGYNAEPIVGETYPCIITRGEITTEKKTGEPYDGEKDWMWRWRITEWNTDSPAPAPVAQPAQQASTPGAQPAAPNPLFPDETMKDDHPRKRDGIERTVVFKAAVDIHVAMGILSPDNPEAMALLAALADDLWVVLQNIGQDAPAATGSDVPPVGSTTVHTGDYAPAEEVEEMPWDDPAPAGFRDLPAFGKWAKEEYGLTSSKCVKIAKEAGFLIETSLELTAIRNDRKLIQAIKDHGKPDPEQGEV